MTAFKPFAKQKLRSAQLKDSSKSVKNIFKRTPLIIYKSFLAIITYEF